MPSSILGHNASHSDSEATPKMTSAQLSPQRLPLRDPPIYPTDEEAVVPKKQKSLPRKVDKKSNEYILKSFLAGGMAGCVAKTVVGPLDRVKILYQTSNPQFQKYTGSWTGVAVAVRDIWRQEGVLGLFRGHSATLLRIFPYAGIKFFAYEQIRARIIKDKSQETPVRRFLSGSLAGSVSVFFTYPLEVIRVRLAFETRRDSRSSLVDICRKIYNEHPPLPKSSLRLDTSSAPRAAASTIATTAAAIQHVTPRSGLPNFFRGFTATLWGMLPYAGSSFLAHDTLSDVMRYPKLAPYTTLPHTERKDSNNQKPAQLKYWAELTTGGFAGFVSQTVSYPLEVIRRRMQVGGVVGDGHRLGMVEVAQRIWLERGWRGFFVGLGIGYVKVIPLAATSFYVYERGKYYLGI